METRFADVGQVASRGPASVARQAPEALTDVLASVRAAVAKRILIGGRYNVSMEPADATLTSTQLTSEPRELILSITSRLSAVSGVSAVVLGGSYARGRARAGSDIDLGVLYSEAAPLLIAEIRSVADSLNDTANPVVTGPYEWGPWVNGGAWLTIGGQRVDFIYRSIEHIERVITEARAGRYDLDYAQQPPFGFFSATYLGEVGTCIALHDPYGDVARLKRSIAEYPAAMREAIVRDFLWSVEFGLTSFARKSAARSDAYATSACLSRAVNQLVQVLFAFNGRYLLNDKTALVEVGEFESAPPQFAARVQETFANLGSSSTDLCGAVDRVEALFRDVVESTGHAYRARFALPS